MSKSLFTVRTAVVGALGAGAISGAMLFGALPMANATQAPVTPGPTAGSGHLELAGIHSHHDHHRHDLHHSVNIL
jgi:hypothetical protein